MRGCAREEKLVANTNQSFLFYIVKQLLNFETEKKIPVSFFRYRTVLKKCCLSWNNYGGVVGCSRATTPPFEWTIAHARIIIPVILFVPVQPISRYSACVSDVTCVRKMNPQKMARSWQIVVVITWTHLSIEENLYQHFVDHRSFWSFYSHLGIQYLKSVQTQSKQSSPPNLHQILLKNIHAVCNQIYRYWKIHTWGWLQKLVYHECYNGEFFRGSLPTSGIDMKMKCITCSKMLPDRMGFHIDFSSL